MGHYASEMGDSREDERLKEARRRIDRKLDKIENADHMYRIDEILDKADTLIEMARLLKTLAR